MECDKVDRTGILIREEQLVELDYLPSKTDLSEYATFGCSTSCILISPNPLILSNRYYSAYFRTNTSERRYWSGEYILDASTKEIMYIYEIKPIPGLLPFNISINPVPLYARKGESYLINVTLSGRPYYDVPDPPIFYIDSIDSGLNVSEMHVEDRWASERIIRYTFNITLDPEIDGYQRQMKFNIELIGSFHDSIYIVRIS